MSEEEITIEEARKEDFSAIWKIFKKIILTGDSYVNDESTTAKEARQKWFSKEAKTFVAKLNNKVIGAYLIRPNQPGRGSHIANCSYIVDKKARGLGVGKMLGLHSINYAKNHSYKALQFNFVVSTNNAAVKLWQSLGFEIIGTIPQAFNHKDLGYVDAFIMLKKL